MYCTWVSVHAQIAPTDDEVKAFENYDGDFEDLAPPEQFLSVLSNIKRLHRKVDALIVMNQFDVRSIEIDVHQLTGTCTCNRRCSNRSQTAFG